MMFDINDFDETLPGPWEWDVKRLCASLRSRPSRTASRPRSASASCSVRHAATRERLAGYTSMRTLELFYDRIASKTSSPTSHPSTDLS